MYIDILVYGIDSGNGDALYNQNGLRKKRFSFILYYTSYILKKQDVFAIYAKNPPPQVNSASQVERAYDVSSGY